MAAKRIRRESRTQSIVGALVICLVAFGVVGGIALAGPAASPQGGAPMVLPAFLIGHVTWQGRPAQPDKRQQLGISLSLKLDKTEINFPVQGTDASGFFTVTVDGLANGAYEWRVKDADYVDNHSTYLANSDTVKLAGAPITRVEMGLMKAGDANGDNVVNMLDFQIVRLGFGPCPQGACADIRADLNGDNTINVSDFNLLKLNFGIAGAPKANVRGR